MSLNNKFGSSSFVTRVSEFKAYKPPHYEDTFVGSLTDVTTSGSSYVANGWKVKYTPGNPWTMFATIDADVDANNVPITTGSSYITSTFALHFNTVEKELLHVSVDGLYNGSYTWLNNINTQDRAILEYYITNPPVSQSITYPAPNVTSSISTPTVLQVSPATGFSGNTTSMSASVVVYDMAKNGCKTIPIVQPVLTHTMVVPSNYIITYFTQNLNRVHLASSVQAQLGMPSNFYNAMPQPSDPSNVAVDYGGSGMPIHYGWLKMPPTITQNGQQLNIEQNWIFGLYYQNIYGTVL